MNRLQKKAKSELIGMGICTLVTIPCLLFLAARNSQGIVYLLICLFVGVPAGFITYLKQMKLLKQFDEREKSILQKAYYRSTGVFIFYLTILSFAIFFTVGGGGLVPVVVLPVMVFAGLFIAKCTESFMILAWCAKEDNE